MNFLGLIYIGWREALIALCVLLSLYVLVAFLRIRSLNQDAKNSALFAPDPNPDSTQEISPTESASTSTALPTEPSFAWNEAPPAASLETRTEALENELVGLRRDHKRIEELENEAAQLRKEVGSLRAEVMILREAQQRDTPKAAITRMASPLYNDAMQMATQGRDADEITQHCGISRAEADLVVALVRNQTKPANT